MLQKKKMFQVLQSPKHNTIKIVTLTYLSVAFRKMLSLSAVFLPKVRHRIGKDAWVGIADLVHLRQQSKG